MAYDLDLSNTTYGVGLSAVQDIGISLDSIVTNSSNVTIPPPVDDPRALTLQTFRFVCEVCLAFPLSILGIAGNFMALVVLSQHKQKLTTTVLLQALAVVDTLILVSTISLRSVQYLNSGIRSDKLWFHYYRWMYPSTYFFRLTGTWLTVLLTVDRFIAVCHPLSASRLCTLRRTYILVTSTIILSFVFSIPRFLEVRIVIDYSPADNITVDGMHIRSSPININQAYTFIYKICLFFLFMYLVPMTTMIVLNGRLLVALRESHALRASLSFSANLKRSTRTNRSVTIIVATVVLVCITCDTSAMVSHSLYTIELCFSHLKGSLLIYRRYVANISNVLVTFNSTVNFVIYCLCSRTFRSVLIRTMRCRNIIRHRPKAVLIKQRSSSSTLTYSSILRGSSKVQLHKLSGGSKNGEFDGMLRPIGLQAFRNSSEIPSPRPRSLPCETLTLHPTSCSYRSVSSKALTCPRKPCANGKETSYENRLMGSFVV